MALIEASSEERIDQPPTADGSRLSSPSWYEILESFKRAKSMCRDLATPPKFETTERIRSSTWTNRVQVV